MKGGKLLYLGFLMGRSYDSLVAQELSKQNKLKEKEIKQQAQQKARDEWLNRLKRTTNESLLEMLNNTDEFITYDNKICGGIGYKTLFDLGEATEINELYTDIKNECIIRGLV